jgi:hypothetical protein
MAWNDPIDVSFIKLVEFEVLLAVEGFERKPTVANSLLQSLKTLQVGESKGVYP